MVERQWQTTSISSWGAGNEPSKWSLDACETKRLSSLSIVYQDQEWLQKGYLQKRTFDFSFFSPTDTQVTLRVILALTARVGFKRWDLDDTWAFISVPLPKGQNLYLPIEGYLIPKRQGTQTTENYWWSHTRVVRFLSVVFQGLHKSRIHSIKIWWVCVYESRRQHENGIEVCQE